VARIEAYEQIGVEVSLYAGTKHTFATDAAARGVSERALQTFLGHADVCSTRRYARWKRRESNPITRNRPTG
jgi:site-specific recombinase XerD